ncbi:hypothetical protein K469DRAFT_727427 [Zopfia rhizophila CBS 207.26]|uniref:Zn(2)-C6 fungal-type domain-containing protein n=1 Tax=Zopfia rhizophila CBS 207.26 TaxID=1314779 RepID=A0A6A6ET94_9PEZI|nr:hypothetical protein K469DRAFT_727427 [Zopfia rhizophila CBS 207.26]
MKKVRIACRRCRAKRIKCDGNVLACGNCQRAGEPCVDVDGRNNALSIPRDFAGTACARIEWLEDQIRRLAPTFNLCDGPRVDFSFMDRDREHWPAPNPTNAPDAAQSPSGDPTTGLSPTAEGLQTVTSGKRTYSSIAEHQPERLFAEEARSVAIDFSMLTLNSDSRQTHYLGTSSGRLFTSLIGLSGTPNTTSHPGSVKTVRSPSLASPPPKLGPFAHAKRLKESCRHLYELLRKSLPLQEDARILLDVYFKDIHVDHPFIHPSSLMNALDGLYQCATADASATIGHNGWIDTVQPFSYNGVFEQSRSLSSTPISIFIATFHVFMAFTLAATVRTRERMYDFAPNQFYHVAMSVAQDCFSTTSIASIQAILFLAVHSLLSPAEVNIWTLTHTFDIQLPTLEDIQADTTAIKHATFAPEIPIANVVAFALHRFKLDSLISEIKLLFYHLPAQVSAYVWPADIESTQESIKQRLEKWRHKISSPSQAIPRPSEDAFLVCYRCAASRLKVYNDLYNADSLYQSWRSVQGIFSSGATMIYCLWTSTAVRHSIPYTQSMRDLRTCTNLLTVGGEWWPSVKKGKESFGRAIDALLKKLNFPSGKIGGKDYDINNSDRPWAAGSRVRPATESTSQSQMAAPFAISAESMETESRILNLAEPLYSEDVDGVYLRNVPTDIMATDWTILNPRGDHEFQNEANHNLSGTFFDADARPSGFSNPCNPT